MLVMSSISPVTVDNSLASINFSNELYSSDVKYSERVDLAIGGNSPL